MFTAPSNDIVTDTTAQARRNPFKRHIERGDAAPLHPGEVLREDFLPYYRLTPSELGRRLQLDPSNIEQLLAERSPVSEELADRLAAVFALPARYWLALQKQYDLWHLLEHADGAD